MIPFWTSFVVRTYAWVNLLQNGGPIEHVLHTLRLSSGSLNILYSPTAVTIGILYSYLPLMILPLFVVARADRPGLEAAASDLGASSRRAFRRVTLPLSMPGVIAGCILVGVPATGEYVIPSILGGGKTLMYGNVIADQFFEVGNYPFGAALAMTMMAVVTLFLVIARVGSLEGRGRDLMLRRLPSPVSAFTRSCSCSCTCRSWSWSSTRSTPTSSWSAGAGSPPSGTARPSATAAFAPTSSPAPRSPSRRA